jgi:RNA polymerase sigma-70 factor (sigma-E family)
MGNANFYGHGCLSVGMLTGAAAHREFDRFVSDSTAELLRAAYLLTWNLTEAEDLVQETFLRAARRWPDIRKMEFPKAYARRVLFNLAIRENVRRSKTRSEFNGGGSFDMSVDERLERRIVSIDARSDLETALAHLPLRQRAVIVLRYYEHLSESEIAEVLGWPAGTVKSTASRALGELRKAFSDPVSSSSVESFVKPVPPSKGVKNVGSN